MHRVSEFGIAAHASYKEGIVQRFINPNLLWIAKLLFPRKNNNETPEKTAIETKGFLNGSAPEWVRVLASEQEEDNDHGQFMENLKQDFFEQRVFVFTPKGDVIDLPIHSSPIDFAYAIHSDVGNHLSGAKVNGKLVSLDSELQNGDIVEIITKEKSKPSKKWLDIAKTVMAKRHIRSALSTKDKDND
jgi:GTP pyrophosphokinase